MLVDITKTAVFNVTMTKCFFCIDFGVDSNNGSDDVVVSVYTDITTYLKCNMILALTAQPVFTQTLQLT